MNTTKADVVDGWFLHFIALHKHKKLYQIFYDLCTRIEWDVIKAVENLSALKNICMDFKITIDKIAQWNKMLLFDYNKTYTHLAWFLLSTDFAYFKVM